MHVEWYGQSAFRLTDDAVTVFIDPFDDLTALAERGVRWEYPAIEGVEADLLLVTHEHLDHNGVGPIAGEPVDTALDRGAPGVADRRGRRRRLRARRRRRHRARPQHAVRLHPRRPARGPPRRPGPERRCARSRRRRSGSVDLLFVPVGDGPTIGAEQAAAIAARLGARSWCRCTTAPSASTSSSPSTPSSSARSASSAWSRARSTRGARRRRARRRRARRAVSNRSAPFSGPPSDHRRRGPD